MLLWKTRFPTCSERGPKDHGVRGSLAPQFMLRVPFVVLSLGSRSVIVGLSSPGSACCLAAHLFLVLLVLLTPVFLEAGRAGQQEQMIPQFMKKLS